MTAPPLLRPGALDGCAVVAGGAYASACAAAGATIVTAAAAPRVDMLLVDAAAAFGDGGPEGLRTALDGAWSEVLAVAREHWLGERDDGGGKRVAFLASTGGEYFSGCRFDLR